MTLYMLLAGLGLVIYGALVIAERTVELSTTSLALLSIALAAVALVYGYPRRRRVVVAALVVFAGGAAVLLAANRQSGDAAAGSRAVVVDRGSARALAVGATLFHERGCIRCHKPDATGVGPTLHGLIGSPVEYPGSGVPLADETYIRESILNPSATIALGFPPVMPTFAGRLTDDELEALIVYVKSLSAPVQIPRQ